MIVGAMDTNEDVEEDVAADDIVKDEEEQEEEEEEEEQADEQEAPDLVKDVSEFGNKLLSLVDAIKQRKQAGMLEILQALRSFDQDELYKKVDALATVFVKTEAVELIVGEEAVDALRAALVEGKAAGLKDIDLAEGQACLDEADKELRRELCKRELVDAREQGDMERLKAALEVWEQAGFTEDDEDLKNARQTIDDEEGRTEAKSKLEALIASDLEPGELQRQLEAAIAAGREAGLPSADLDEAQVKLDQVEEDIVNEKMMEAERLVLERALKKDQASLLKQALARVKYLDPDDDLVTRAKQRKKQIEDEEKLEELTKLGDVLNQQEQEVAQAHRQPARPHAPAPPRPGPALPTDHRKQAKRGPPAAPAAKPAADRRGPGPAGARDIRPRPSTRTEPTPFSVWRTTSGAAPAVHGGATGGNVLRKEPVVLRSRSRNRGRSPRPRSRSERRRGQKVTQDAAAFQWVTWRNKATLLVDMDQVDKDLLLGGVHAGQGVEQDYSKKKPESDGQWLNTEEGRAHKEVAGRTLCYGVTVPDIAGHDDEICAGATGSAPDSWAGNVKTRGQGIGMALAIAAVAACKNSQYVDTARKALFWQVAEEKKHRLEDLIDAVAEKLSSFRKMTAAPRSYRARA